MEKVFLGNTDIEVSRLCFGSLTMTPYQANLSLGEGASLIEYAYERGINFLDTAQIYENYNYISRALKNINRYKYVIASKTYAYTREMAKDALEESLINLNTDYMDIFLLHEQESIHTIRGHLEAVEYFKEAKKQGKIRAFGISTHRIAGLKASLEVEDIEIIHPLVNKAGIGIADGSIDEMLVEIKKAKDLGKGIYSMKPLGGGHLISSMEEAFRFVRDIKNIHSIAIGMQSKDEIDANIKLLETDHIPRQIKDRIDKKNRKLIIGDYCIACGNCVKRCRQKGIKIEGDIAVPNENCILCGYCAAVCPEFCIKVI